MTTQVLGVVMVAVPLIAALLWALSWNWRGTLAFLGFYLLVLAVMGYLILGVGLAMGLGVPW